MEFIQNTPQQVEASEFVSRLSMNEISSVKEYIVTADNQKFLDNQSDVDSYVQSLDETGYQKLLDEVNVPSEKKFVSGWSLFRHKIPTWIFLITTLVLTVLAFKHELSLIPLLGLVSCLYMMSELGLRNWIGFGGWLLVGLIIYFGFSYKNSRLNKKAEVV